MINSSNPGAQAPGKKIKKKIRAQASKLDNSQAWDIIGHMNKKEARQITGGLSAPSKMPGPAFYLPAQACITGAKLVKIPGSVCHGCYALKGRYRFRNVKEALARRLASLTHPQWIPAMVVLIDNTPWFRWHDSGDLQSVQHLKNIFEVCLRTPNTRHWLPTREARFLPLNFDSIPKNLIIRLSGHKINRPAAGFWPWTSTVVTEMKSCPAKEQGNQCKDCRACWSRDTANIAYPLH